MIRILLFALGLNGLIAFVLHITEWVFGIPELNFISDYFFYALIAQWILGAIFLVARPGRDYYLKHSPAQATRMAASMANDGKANNEQSNFDVGLSMLLFISGGFSLLMCIIL
ncbi:hypothetical protein [Vibrio atypicus]|jgi:hypothetical protein|uniref:hypothetical protein n=1 Tax=Vibrio atypicus TaxID=558271 RepID=UPI001358ABAB|nr:hypothetical protein [Vibrio atypicus]